MDVLKKLSIRNMMLLLLSIPVLLFASDVLFSVNKLNTTSELSQVMHERVMPSQETVLEIKSLFKDVRLSNTKLSYAKTDNDRNRYKEEMRKTTDTIIARLNELQKNMPYEEGMMLIEKLKVDINDYYTLSLQKDTMRDDVEKMAHFVKTQTTPKGAMIDEAIRNFVSDISNVNDKVKQEVIDVTRTGTIIVISIFAFCFGMLLMYIVLNKISNNIAVLAGRSAEIAKGDLSHFRVRNYDNHARNEITQLYASFNGMVGNLRELVQAIQSDAENLSVNSNQMSNAQMRISENTKEVLAQTISISTAFEEMAQTAKEIAKSCNCCAVASNQAHAETQRGMELVKRTVDKIRHHSHQTLEDSKVVKDLGEQTKEINSIVYTIQGIADQTNLLALNAAIEAARAGEHGKGFAVVAEEVRHLASKTADSTKEITSMVHALQQKAANANQSISSTVDQMEVMANEAAEVEETLARIMEEVEGVTHQVSQIATATEEQTSVANEMANNVACVTNVTKEMAEQAQESAKSSINIKEMALAMKENTKKFKV